MFFLYYLFGYLERGARRNSHSYQIVVDERIRYCHRKDFLVVVPGGGKLCPAACNGFKLLQLSLLTTSDPQEQLTTRPHCSTGEVVHDEDVVSD